MQQGVSVQFEPQGCQYLCEFLGSETTVLKEYSIIPWKDRIQIPVFRGTAHGKMHGLSKVKPHRVLDFVLERCLRCRVVHFSTLHPDLVNAKFHRKLGELFNPEYRPLIENSTTNGLHYLLPISKIPTELFFTNYQSALVLCGIGSAFQIVIHLSTETAMVLQACPFDKWFTKLMKPWEHFIPLDYELTMLNETMHWIQDHLEKVREISLNGRQFYLDYLSRLNRPKSFCMNFCTDSLSTSNANICSNTSFYQDLWRRLRLPWTLRRP